MKDLTSISRKTTPNINAHTVPKDFKTKQADINMRESMAHQAIFVVNARKVSFLKRI